MFRVVFPPIIRSAYNCIYSIWCLSRRYCYLPLSWKSWNRFECAVGGVLHPQHAQTGYNRLYIQTPFYIHIVVYTNNILHTHCCIYKHHFTCTLLYIETQFYIHIVVYRNTILHTYCIWKHHFTYTLLYIETPFYIHIVVYRNTILHTHCCI